MHASGPSHARNNNIPAVTSRLCKGLDKLCQLLGSVERNRVVVAGADATDAAVPLEARQPLARGLLEESLFRVINVAILGAS